MVWICAMKFKVIQQKSMKLFIMTRLSMRTIIHVHNHTVISFDWPWQAHVGLIQGFHNKCAQNRMCDTSPNWHMGCRIRLIEDSQQ